MSLRTPVLALVLAACSGPTPATPTDTSANVTVEAAPDADADEPKPAEDVARTSCYRGMGEIAQSMRGTLRVQVYAHPNTGRVGAVATAIEAIVTRVQKQAPSKVKVEVVDASTEELQQEAKEKGVQMVSFEEEGTMTLGMLGIVLEYGSEREVIPTISLDQVLGMEFWVANKMREIRDRNDERHARVGVVKGKQEISLDDANLVPPDGARKGPTLRGILEQALPFYKLEDVDISTAVDPKLVGLIVTQPGEDYSDEELRRIDDFVMQGGGLTVVASAVNMPAADAKMEGTLDMHRLDVLLSGYGVEMKPRVVLDPTLGLKVPVVTTSGTDMVQAAGILLLSSEGERPTLNNGFAGFFRMYEIAFPFASPLSLDRSTQPDAKFEVVASSSPQAVSVATSPIDLSLKRQGIPAGQAKTMSLGVTVQGTIRSAFDPKVKSEARVLVLSSSQFLANPFARAGNPPPMPPQMAMMGAFGGDEVLQRVAKPYAQNYLTPTILAFKNTLDWMAANDDIIACSALLAAAKEESKEDEPTSKGRTGCSKEQLSKMMDAGLSIDEALEVCAKQKKK